VVIMLDRGGKDRVTGFISCSDIGAVGKE